MAKDGLMPCTPGSKGNGLFKIQQEMPAGRFIRYALSVGAITLAQEDEPHSKRPPSPIKIQLPYTGRAISELASSFVGAYNATRPDILFGAEAIATATAVILGNSVGISFLDSIGGLRGAPIQGKRVLVMDDHLQPWALEKIKRHGGIPVAKAITFDMQTRKDEDNLTVIKHFEKEYGIPVFASATLADLISVLKKILASSDDDKKREMLEKILAYQKQYSIA